MKTYKQNLQRLNESGFTLMESLVAIVVLTIMLVGIAPMIVLSTATRVQARRVEIATKGARSYMDAVRAGTIAPPNSIVVLDEIDDEGKFESKRDEFAAKVGPAGNALSTPCKSGEDGYPYCPNPTKPTAGEVSLYCIDNDETPGCSNSPNDMIVQAYRSVTAIPKTDEEEQEQLDRGYLLGVRVYRADAFDGDTTTLKTVGSGGALQKSSGTTLDRKAPLVEITTEIVGTNTTYEGFCDRFGGCDK